MVAAAVWMPFFFMSPFLFFSFHKKSIWQHEPTHIWKQRRPRLALSLVLKPPGRNSKAKRSGVAVRGAENQPALGRLCPISFCLRPVHINQCVRIIGGEERCENTPGTWRPVTAMIRLSKWLMSDRWVSESGRWMRRILMIVLSRRFLNLRSNSGIWWLI